MTEHLRLGLEVAAQVYELLPARVEFRVPASRDPELFVEILFTAEAPRKVRVGLLINWDLSYQIEGAGIREHPTPGGDRRDVVDEIASAVLEDVSRRQGGRRGLLP